MTTHTFTQMKTIYSFSDKCQVFRQQLFRTLHQHSLRSTPGWPPSPVSRWHRAHSYSYIFVHSAWPGGGGRHVLEWWRCPGRARTRLAGPGAPTPAPAPPGHRHQPRHQSVCWNLCQRARVCIVLVIPSTQVLWWGVDVNTGVHDDQQ